MGFLDSLRMNGIYGNPSEGFGVPHGGGINLDEISGALNRIYPFIAAEKDKQRQHEMNMMQMRMAGPGLDKVGANLNGPAVGQPQVNFDMNSYMNSPSQRFANDILNPPERSLPFQKLAADYAMKGANLNEKAREFEGRQDIRGRETDIKQQRADIYDFKSKHPNMKILAPKGGNFQAMDPITGKTMDLGISTGSLNEEDRLNLTGDIKSRQIGEIGEEARKTQGLKGEQSLAEISARGAQTRQTNEAKDKGMLPTQQRTDQFLKARQLASDPQYSSFIKIGEGGNFTIVPSGDEMMDKIIRDKIYGTGAKDINLPKESIKKQSDPLGIR